MTVRTSIALGACLLASAGTSFGQASSRAVFIAHYFPVNTVSPQGATVAAFRINADDTATLVGNFQSGEWTQSLALSPNGRFLAAANGTAATSEELRVFRVNADASLTQVHLRMTPDSPLDMVWVSDTVLAVTLTNSGMSRILTYHWSEAAAMLTLADSEPSGYFNSAVVKHPLHPWIYTQDSGVFGGAASVQQWSVAENGVLTALTNFPSIDPPLKPSISPNGLWMFSGTGAFGANTVSVFGLDPITGAGIEIVGSPFGSPGDTPYRTAVSRDNRFVFVGHTVDDTVQTFTLDNELGVVTPTNSFFDAGPRSSLGPIAVLDDLLIVVRDANDPIGMWVFRIGNDGVLTQVGSLYNTGNRRPELAMVTWNPPAVACPADLDGDGTATLQDLFDFLGLWFAGDTRADVDGAAGITVDDLFEYLGLWFSGC